MNYTRRKKIYLDRNGQWGGGNEISEDSSNDTLKDFEKNAEIILFWQSCKTLRVGIMKTKGIYKKEIILEKDNKQFVAKV